MKKSYLAHLTLITGLLAMLVVILGAYTRLSNAGLGCPDWPGCYGSIIVPKHISRLSLYYPVFSFDKIKAWTEMIHRYAAGILAISVCITALLSFLFRRQYKISLFFPVMLILLIFFQAILGMWTVTWKLLPQVVVGHLMGGFFLVTLLWCFRLHLGNGFAYSHVPNKSYYYWAWGGLLVLVTQILLGGWVSTNYAGLACLDFPTCNGYMWPDMDFKQAFNLFSPIGANYQGGLLDMIARATIQMMHRFGALITAIYLIIFSGLILKNSNSFRLCTTAVLIICLVVMQITLGVLNIVQLLAVPITVAHNVVALLLLLTVSTLVYGITYAEIEKESA